MKDELRTPGPVSQLSLLKVAFKKKVFLFAILTMQNYKFILAFYILLYVAVSDRTLTFLQDTIMIRCLAAGMQELSRVLNHTHNISSSTENCVCACAFL